MTGQPPAHQPPPSSSGTWNDEMIPAFSTYDPETVSNQAQQYHAQRYQEWIDSYQQGQQQHPQSSYSTFGTRENQSQSHQFNFVQRLPTTFNQSAGQYGSQHANPQYSTQSDGYGYYPGNDIRTSSQNHLQVQGHPYQNGQNVSSDIASVGASSRASSHGHSPTAWTEDGAIFDITSNPTTQPTPAHPSSSSTQGLSASQRPPQQTQSVRRSPSVTVSPQGPSSSNRNGGKRKRGARKGPADSSEQATYKRFRDRDRDSDDESGEDDDFGISVGIGGLTGVSGTVNGKRGRAVRLKREYLLAQIKQKDAIIESLLRQLHNPYIATPLSIASYRMATSPSDTGNRNVMAWLDRLQSSVQNAGGKIGTKAFKLDGRGDGNEEEEESDKEDNMTHAQRYGLVDRDAVGTDSDEAQDGNDEDGDDSKNTRRLQSSLPDSHVPLGLIANLSLSNTTKRASKKDGAGGGANGKKEDLLDDTDLDDDNVGVANETYFMPGPATDLDIRATLIEQHSPPEILVHGLVTPDDVDHLFEIFYTRVNPFVSILDPAIHTPAATFARCPFLFTVICAVSSRYYAEKSEIYPIAMHFAKHSAANALVDGWKSVELCQAYILMSIYAVPARRWEEDRSWLYTGLAIRIATDLNLHMLPATKSHNEKQEREVLNRMRVWMICFNLDRSTATQFGKPSTIKEDYIVRTSADWFKKSQYNLDVGFYWLYFHSPTNNQHVHSQFDVHLCAHTALLRIVARFHEEIFSDPGSPSGLNKRVDFRTVTLKHDEHLTRYQEEWSKTFKDRLKPDDPGAAFRCSLLPYLVAYSRLVMFSFGFQQAFQRGVQQGDNIFLTKCLESAKGVITYMVDSLAPSGYMRYAPDGHFVFASFASAFLLKLLRPEFSSLLPKEEGSEIYQLIGRLIQTLSSPTLAIDDRHTPKLYARFLAGLLSHHRRDGATVGRLQTQPPPPQQIGNGEYGAQSVTHAPSTASTISTFSIAQNSTAPGASSSLGFADGYSHAGESGATSTPIFRPEATYTAGAGAIQFDIDPTLMDFEGQSTSDGSEMLATMQVVKNPNWWTNMMMPGYVATLISTGGVSA
ncbi:hypothetical protein AAF712_005955 [Marasmius tenuissimus]|uniref:Xylanolytic transcriptional activator regulatory domain-containing protein n=1 Tax=Marasmius tenuissimus TaxID=585030 RepID=A0ABR2ZYY9_9AGAR